MRPRIDLDALYPDHVATMKARLSQALEACDLRGVVIASGTPKTSFLDDHTYPFTVNPHFKAWLPLVDLPESLLLLRDNDRPVLFYNQPHDYWHKPPSDPAGFWTNEWDIQIITSLSDAHNSLGDSADLAFIGEESGLAKSWGFTHINPRALLDQLHFHRAFKTPYEVAALQLANLNAVRGHVAAEAAFRRGESEFDIQHLYLGAIRSREKQTPYTSIVALNENCAALHYQHYELDPPPHLRSMLIDAGASMNGYAADITRTYAARPGPFSDLIDRMDDEQRGIIGDIAPGMNYRDLHTRMHLRLAHVLRDFKLVDMSPEAMVETNITSTFLPHGLGHLLGLQTHDIGGYQQNQNGDTLPPPDEYPALRLTRPIEDNQVFTIEPGLYFIPMLLAEMQASPHGKHVSWDRVEALMPYGGIRIEDNVLIQEGTPVNLTREAFEAVNDEDAPR